MKRTIRAASMAVVAGLLGLVLAVVPSQFSPEQAHAAIAPGLPGPINVLPSVAKASTSMSAYEALYVMVYSSMLKAGEANAALKVSAGTATQTEAQLVASFAKKYKGLPATVGKGLLKVAGPVGVAVTGFDTGLSIGQGIVSLAGWDAQRLCTTGAAAGVDSGWLSALNGVDCAPFAIPDPAFYENANQDITAMPPGWVVPPAWRTTYGAGGTGVLTYEFVGPAPAFASAATQLIRGTLRISGTCANAGWPSPGLSIRAYALRTSTGVVGLTGSGLSGGSLNGGNVGYPCEKLAGDATAVTMTPSSGYVFDHLEFYTQTPQPGQGQQFIKWYPEGHQNWTPGVEADPERQFECRVHLTSGGPLKALSEPFREASGVLPPVVCPTEIPDGVGVTGMEIWEVGGGQEHMLTEQTVTPEFQQVRDTMADCLGGGCVLHLVKDDVSCMEVPGPCADWYEDPDKADHYQCKWGAHSVALSECTVLAPYYKPGAGTSGAPYGDVNTGQPVPNPLGRAPINDGVSDPEKPRDCFPNGWDILNPVEWVLKPVQCALEWAFVPRTQKVEDVANRASNAWRGTQLMKTIATFEALGAVLADLDDGGCDGITIDLSSIGAGVLNLGSYKFLQACPGDFFYPWAGPVKAFLVIVITFAGGFSVKSQVSRFVGNGEA